MGAQHQGLLDVCRLGWAGDKYAKSMFTEGDALVSSMHVRNDLRSIERKREMLGDKRRNPLRKGAFGHPDGSVLGYTQYASTHEQYEARQLIFPLNLLRKNRFLTWKNGLQGRFNAAARGINYLPANFVDDGCKCIQQGCRWPGRQVNRRQRHSRRPIFP